MKILWITSIALPEHMMVIGCKGSVFGGWLTGLLFHLRRIPDLEIAVASPMSCRRFSKIEHDGVIFYSIPRSNRKLTQSIINDFQQAEKDFAPDVIHVHGSEYYQGRICADQYLKTPAVLSIQGILSGACEWSNGNLLQSELPFSLKELIRHHTLTDRRKAWQKRAEEEKHILQGFDFLAGRTEWDHAYVKWLNPEARYFHAGEILRPAFYRQDGKWSLPSMRRHSIFANLSSDPLKGGHILLRACELLSKHYPDLILNCTGIVRHQSRLLRTFIGNSYEAYLDRLVDQTGMRTRVHFKGYMTEEEMREELCSCHTFVSTSFIDNSPNALGEAQIMGVPIVATRVGGVESMVVNGKTGLLCMSGDPYVLAEKIDNIWQNDILAEKLSGAERTIAAERHSPQKIVDEVVKIYQEVAAVPPQKEKI